MSSDSDSVVFRALADPTRRRLLELLRVRPLPVGRLAEAFPVSRPAISRHLRLLREAGLVREERRGRARLYRPQLETLLAVGAWLDQLAADEPAPPVRRPGRRRPRRPRDHPGEAAAPAAWRVW